MGGYRAPLGAFPAIAPSFERAGVWWGRPCSGSCCKVLVVEVPFLQVAFGTTPLTLVQWGIRGAMASIILWVEEIRNLWAWLVRR